VPFFPDAKIMKDSAYHFFNYI